jgi:pimeloyl-ACP methyl ester carboxylesterase
VGQALRDRRAALAVIAVSLLLAASVVGASLSTQDAGDWRADRLDGFEARTFTFPDDYDGPVTATLVRRPHEQKQPCAVLYLHGWADYFFQVQLADFFERTLVQTAGRGCDFFALDLRKHGRSLPTGYKYPNFALDLDEYFPEITQRSLSFAPTAIPGCCSTGTPRVA